MTPAPERRREALARRLHAQGKAATAAGRPAAGARILRKALQTLAGDDPDQPGQAAESGRLLQGRIMLTLAAAEGDQGHVGEGLQLLAQAATLLPDQTIVHAQRGLFLARTGRNEEAIAELDLAVTASRDSDDPIELSRMLLNRGYTRLMAGQTEHTRSDLMESERLARLHQQHGIAVKCTQNLGWYAFLLGNMPDALRQLDEAARECARYLPSYLPSIALDKARVLLAAGLADDAGDELDRAIPALRRQRFTEELAEAQLARAAAALLAGQPAAAERWAAAARRRFLSRDNQAGAAQSALARLRADFVRTSPAMPLARRGARLADSLNKVGLGKDAKVAALLTVRAYVRAGRVDLAADVADKLPVPQPDDPLELRLLWHLAQAELAAARGQHRQHRDHLVTGLARLHQHRTSLGSVDLQTSLAIHGRELAAAALACALTSRQPDEVFACLEMIRAQAFRVTRVRPSDDPVSARALGELRHVLFALHRAERRQAPVGRLPARRAELEQVIRERTWFHPGTGTSTPVATLPAVLDRLGDRAIVSYVRSQGTLTSLVLTATSRALVELGAYATAEEQLRRLHADLDALASHAVPDRLLRVLTAAARHDGRQLADTLITPLHRHIGERSVVVVPTGALFTVPWLQLPPFQGRPVVVAPSATAWLTAERATSSPPARSIQPALLVAGPGINHGEREINAIAEILPDVTILTGDAATPMATLNALDGAPLAHLAAHGNHQTGNALFSSLDLAGGTLMGYDLQQLHRPPQQVVLSACNVGLSKVRAGDEIIGMVAALLASGTRTVIASVCRVNDQTVPEVTIRYHQLSARGAPPADALAAACSTTSFVCYGSG